jgi:formylglycine-generating enzyme required for sulfatase activity
LPSPSPSSSPPPSPSPSARREPSWYLALPTNDKPRFPLPKGLVFGERPGEYVNEKDGSVLLFVAAGSVTIGSEDPENSPPHEVKLSAYFVGKVELTNARYERFVAASSYKGPSEEPGGFLGFGTDVERTRDETVSRRKPLGTEAAPPDHPVVHVTWDDAQAYCKWAGLRLPTEAEWERAASFDRLTGKKRYYPWGDEPLGPGPLRANLPDPSLTGLFPGLAPNFSLTNIADGFAGSAPVGTFPAGASAIGALDMAGNVREWCEDSFDRSYYRRSPRLDPVCRDDVPSRVTRGGSFATSVAHATSTDRSSEARIFKTYDLGFRVARAGL